MITIDNLINFNQESITLNIGQNIQIEAWNIVEEKSSSQSRWQSYLNLMVKRLCFNWLSEIKEKEEIRVDDENDLLEIWEFVNGFAINLAGKRVIFIPSESDDLGEITVPAEWVDVEKWAGDFYVAVQINPDDGWLRIWGYCSYESLKIRGKYDAFNRSYGLGEEELEDDLMFMLVSMPYQEKLYRFIPELGILTPRQAEDLLTGLEGFKDYELRLIFPFSQWGLLLSDKQWRSRLYEMRKPISLSAWIKYNFQQAMLTGWQSLESLNVNLGVTANGINGVAVRSGGVSIDAIYHANDNYQRRQAIEAVARIKCDTVEGQRAIAALTYVLNSCEDEETRWSAELSLRNLDPHNRALGAWRGKILKLSEHEVVMVLGTLPKSLTQTSIFVRIYPWRLDLLPENLIVRIIDETGKEFEKIISRSIDNLLQYKFWGQPGEKFSLHLQLGNAEITESFVI